MTTTICTAEATEDLQRIMHCKGVPPGGMKSKDPSKGSGRGEGSQDEPPQRSQAREEVDDLHDRIIGIQAALEVLAAGIEHRSEHLNEKAEAYHNARLSVARVLNDTARDLNGACSYLAAAVFCLEGKEKGAAWFDLDGASNYAYYNAKMLCYVAQACAHHSKRIWGNDRPNEWEIINELSERLSDLGAKAQELMDRLREAGL